MTTPKIQGVGHTTVAKKALVSACSAITAQALGVSTGCVRTSLFDDRGKLGIAVSVDYPLPRLDLLAADTAYLSGLQGNLFAALARARADILARASYLCGAEIGAVDLKLEGITDPQKEVRVR